MFCGGRFHMYLPMNNEFALWWVSELFQEFIFMAIHLCLFWNVPIKPITEKDFANKIKSTDRDRSPPREAVAGPFASRQNSTQKIHKFIDVERPHFAELYQKKEGIILLLRK